MCDQYHRLLRSLKFFLHQVLEIASAPHTYRSTWASPMAHTQEPHVAVTGMMDSTLQAPAVAFWLS